jgi:hypothetical protein
MDELCRLLCTPKTLAQEPNWVAKNNGLRLSVPLIADGVVLRGINLVANCTEDRPDEKVSILLTTEIKGRKPAAFARYDWKGPPHVNTTAWSGDLQHVDVGPTHFHDTALHQHISRDVLFSGRHNLPIARKIDPAPGSFAELLADATKLLYIEDLIRIPTPPWQPPLTSLL